ncbi:MAG: Uma2 family endonuclease [Planctomycetaceae bacterium]|nr:Uma2 family endonuclease [Planctomycetaceae bacterium]
MSIGSIRLTRADDGRRMTWEEYVQAESDEELTYELSRGVLAVIEVPQVRHNIRASLARRQFDTFWAKNPKRIQLVAAGSECRIPIESLNSDRHPDLAIYLDVPPAEVPADEFWSTWIPAIVVEIVSPSSIIRDYHEKPDEYFQFGVSEYWIVDAEKNEMLVYRRVAGRWRTTTVRPGELYRPAALSGFVFDLSGVFEWTDTRQESE